MTLVLPAEEANPEGGVWVGESGKFWDFSDGSPSLNFTTREIGI